MATTKLASLKAYLYWVEKKVNQSNNDDEKKYFLIRAYKNVKNNIKNFSEPELIKLQNFVRIYKRFLNYYNQYCNSK